jgi:hypothetical protein
MRFLAILAAICGLCQAASAKTPECKSIASQGARLACYDKAAAPVAPTAKPASQAAPASKVDAGKVEVGKYVDSISAEDALMNARLKNICRGC